MNGTTEPSGEVSRVKNPDEQVPDVMPADTGGGAEENLLRDAIYRSSRSGWTNADRSRQQQQQQPASTV